MSPQTAIGSARPLRHVRCFRLQSSKGSAVVLHQGLQSSCRRWKTRDAPACIDRRRQAELRTYASAPRGSSPGEYKAAAPVPTNRETPAFGSLERQIASNLNTQQPSLRSDWTEVEECWVLGPPNAGTPKRIIHFIGGAFVGAAPQLSYRALLEALAARDNLIIAAPFATGFDHTRIAGEVYSRLDRATRTVDPNLPIFGLGHSMGSLLHLLICSSYPVQRSGNVLMSFNNKDVLEAIPFFAPFIAPQARALGPILSQLATSPLRTQIEAPLEILRGLSPGLVRQFLPILDQLLPIYMDVSQGRQEFTPSPAQTKNTVRSQYGVPRNLLIQFEDDKIDETAELARALEAGGALGSQLDLTLRVLPGDHIQPLLLTLGSLPPELANIVSQGNQFLEQFSTLAAEAGGQMGTQFQDVAKNLSNLASGISGGNSSAAQVAAIELLAATVDDWMAAQSRGSSVKELPRASKGFF